LRRERKLTITNTCNVTNTWKGIVLLNKIEMEVANVLLR